MSRGCRHGRHFIIAAGIVRAISLTYCDVGGDMPGDGRCKAGRQDGELRQVFINQGKRDMAAYVNRRWLFALLLLSGMSVAVQPASAAATAYNMTTRTDFTGVYLAPESTTSWGPNQALNDPDKSLDTTERLVLTGLAPAHYDVKLVTKDGRTYFVKNADLTKKNSFLIKEGQLTGCH